MSAAATDPHPDLMTATTLPDRDWETMSFRFIAESVTDLIAVLDRNGRRVYISPSYSALFGDVARLRGTDSFAEIHPGDRERIRRLFDETVSTGNGQRAEFRFLLRDGQVRHMESEASVMRDGAGAVSHVVVVSRDITDRTSTEQRLDMALESGGIAIFEWNIVEDLIYVSEQWGLLFGGEPAQLVTTTEEFVKSIHADHRRAFFELRRLALTGRSAGGGSSGVLLQQQFRYATPGGEWLWLEARGRVVDWRPDGRVARMVGTLADVSRHKRAEERIRRLSDLNTAWSAISRVIVRTTDTTMLFDEACRIAVEFGGMSMAWIGLLDAAGRRLERAAAGGDNCGYLATLPWSLDGGQPMGGGPAATATRAGRPCICNDMFNDPITVPWRDAARVAGYKSTAYFPIRRGRGVIGVLGLYSAQTDFFNEEMVDLLEEMASDVSFALDNLDRDAERRRALSSLLDSEARKSAILESALDCIITADHEGRIVDFNPAAERTFGWQREEIRGRKLAETIIPPAHRDAHEHGWTRYLATGEAAVLGRRIELTALRADGSEFPVELAVTAIRTHGKPQFTAYVRDISEQKRAQEIVRASENRYRHLIESSPEPMFVNHGGEVVLANPAFVKLLKAPSAEALLGRSPLDFIHPDYHAPVRDRIKVLLTDRVAVPFMDEQYVRADGSIVDVEAAATPFDYDGEPAIQVVVRDISERKRSERLLRQLAEGTSYAGSNEFFPALVRHLAEALEVRCAVLAECLHEGLRRARVLALWMDGEWLSGYDYDVENTPCDTLLREGDLCIYRSGAQSHFPGNTRLAALEAECYLGATLRDTSGRIIGHLFAMDDRPLQDAERAQSIVRIFAARAAVELERKRAEDSMRFMAHHDALTLLPNRVLLQDRMQQAIAHANRHETRIAVLFVDLDRFKNINDTLGHDAGDQGLKELAARLRTTLRESDTVARVGGDEFMAVIDDISEPRGVSDIAQKILDAVARPFVIEGQECHLTASIGIATYPDDGGDVQSLLKNADIAMYRAKGAGKNNYQFYSAQMNVHTVERLTLESRLRRAIESEEFVLYYQPKIKSASGRIVGAEALVRWQHPELGLIGPDRFIPVAEETGLIVSLGQQVLQAACAQASEWRREGLDAGRMAVNLSARQFIAGTLLDDVQRVLARTGLDPHCLELEITESVMMYNPEQAEKQMKQLSEAGVRLTIDDFGTGYSSLAYLKRFPINCVKIDRVFIRGVPLDGDDTAITRAVIALAHSLRISVVAEGVENGGQMAFLKAHGCDEIQGYVYSPPLTATEFRNLLQGLQSPQPPDPTVR